MKNDVLRKATLIIAALWVVIQVVLIAVYWNYPLSGDSYYYNGHAEDYYGMGLWYPSDINSIIVAEPLINSLILQLKLFGTLETNKILNLMMNIGILLSVFIIAKKLFNEKVAYVSCILFCLLYSNSLIVLGTKTEIPFVFFLLLSLAALKPKWPNVILAGFCMGMAEWYRPLMPVFIPGLILYMFFEKYDKKYYLAFIASLAISVACIGLFNYHQTGKYFINPTTGGANLFMTANDKATGATALHLLDDPEVAPHISDRFNELQKDSVYKAAAVDWIKRHPVKYSALYIKKIVGLYIEDSWPDRAIMHNNGKFSLYLSEKDYGSLLGMALLMFFKSLVYYCVLALFIYSIVKHRKDLLSSKGTIITTLLLGTLATCLFVVSSTYHYPYMYAIIIWAAYGIVKKKNLKTTKR